MNEKDIQLELTDNNKLMKNKVWVEIPPTKSLVEIKEGNFFKFGK